MAQPQIVYALPDYPHPSGVEDDRRDASTPPPGEDVQDVVARTKLVSDDPMP